MSNPFFLSHFDGVDGQTTYTAETQQPLAFHNSAQLDTAQIKFGPSSLLLNYTTNDYVTAPQSPIYDFGSGDFTIDAWVFLDEALGNQRAMLHYAGGTPTWTLANGLVWQLWISAGGLVYFQYLLGENSNRDITGVCPNISHGWHHVAVTRGGDTFRIFVDGTAIATETHAETIQPLTSGSPNLQIGTVDELYFWNGWIDEVRVLKGTAVWTSNFTPPTQPYPNPSTTTTVIYDDFRGTTVDTNRWVVFPGSGSITQSAGLIIESGSNSWNVTGVISNSFVKSNTSRVRFLCTQNNANVVGLQTQNTSLNINNLICVDLQSHFYIFSASPSVDTGFTCSDSIEYEISFVITGNDVSIIVNGGGYTEQTIYTASGIMTASTYYAAIQTFYAGFPFVCNSVSADLIAPPSPPLTIAYDDFDGPTLDTNKWVVIGSVTQSSGQVVVNGGGVWNGTGIISKNSFAKATTPSIRVLCTPNGINNVVALQLQNAVLTEPGNVPLIVELITVYFYSPNILILRASSATYVTSVVYTLGVEYEINFVLSGNDIDVRLSGGAYNDVSLYTEVGLITVDTVYVALNSYQSGISCNSVSYDKIAEPTPPGPSPSGKVSANPTGINRGLGLVRTGVDQVITVVDNLAITSRGNVVVVA